MNNKQLINIDKTYKFRDIDLHIEVDDSMFAQYSEFMSRKLLSEFNISLQKDITSNGTIYSIYNIGSYSELHIIMELIAAYISSCLNLDFKEHYYLILTTLLYSLNKNTYLIIEDINFMIKSLMNVTKDELLKFFLNDIEVDLEDIINMDNNDKEILLQQILVNKSVTHSIMIDVFYYYTSTLNKITLKDIYYIFFNYFVFTDIFLNNNLIHYPLREFSSTHYLKGVKAINISLINIKEIIYTPIFSLLFLIENSNIKTGEIDLNLDYQNGKFVINNNIGINKFYELLNSKSYFINKYFSKTIVLPSRVIDEFNRLKLIKLRELNIIEENMPINVVDTHLAFILSEKEELFVRYNNLILKTLESTLFFNNNAEKPFAEMFNVDIFYIVLLLTTNNTNKIYINNDIPVSVKDILDDTIESYVGKGGIIEYK